MVTAVPGCADLYYADVPMFGNTSVNSPYILDSAEPAIIDTGPADSVEELFEALEALSIQPAEVSYIVPTHAHLDHAGGAGHLAAECKNATVVCHERAMPFLTDEAKLDHLAESVERAIGMPSPYGEPRVIDDGRCVAFSGGETLDIGKRTLDIVDAPGHAPHQLCLYDRDTAVLFSADANGMRFGENHRPTTPPPDFDLEASLDTLDRLASFEPERVLYPHFGPGKSGAGTREISNYREILQEFVAQVTDAHAEHGDDVGTIVAELDDRWSHWALTTDVAGVLASL